VIDFGKRLKNFVEKNFIEIELKVVFVALMELFLGKSNFFPFSLTKIICDIGKFPGHFFLAILTDLVGYFFSGSVFSKIETNPKFA
jgi:hypothetical protein